jgi:very-short-patch-repair endonuclease
MSLKRETEHEPRQRRLMELADHQAGVVTWKQLDAIGFTRGEVRANLRARRWQRQGRECLVVHNGPLQDDARSWLAVFQTGADAAIDGVSSLKLAGLEHFDEPRIHVSVSKGTRYLRPIGVRVHETRRRRTPDVTRGAGPPRVRTEIATIRAALWARSDRQAALIIAMAVQQRLTTSEALLEAFTAIRRDKRRKFIAGVLRDVAMGAESIGELDFVRECRRRDLPRPSRQVRRRLPSGQVVLDVYWDEFGVVVEIEGMHHLLAGVSITDSLRQNELTIEEDKVLRIPVLGLRVAADEFFDQLGRMLRRNGWRQAA